MSITLAKNMANRFNHRHEEYVHPRLLGKHSIYYINAYRGFLLNIQDKSSFWDRLETFFAKCCDRIFNTHIIASQQDAIRREIKEVSREIYSNLPDYSQIRATTKESLYANEAQGYIIGQDGFKIVAYSGIKIIDQQKGKFSYTDKMELINLDDKNKYDNLMFDLKAVHDDDEWNIYLRGQIKRLIPKLNIFRTSSLEFAKENAGKFMEEYPIAVNSFNENDIKPEELSAIIEFNLNYNYTPGLDRLINRFNSTLLKEIFNYCKKDEQNRFPASDQGIIASVLLKALEPLNNPIQAADRDNHQSRVKLLENAFRRAGEGVYAVLEEGYKNHKQQELFEIIISITENLLPPNTSDLQPNVLYTNEEEGYRIVQHGRSIFLYSSKPFTGLNQRLKTEIKALHLASNNDYNNLKYNLKLNNRLDYLKCMVCNGFKDKLLLRDFKSIVGQFARDNSAQFNELFTIKSARNLEIELAEDLTKDIIDSSGGNLEFLARFFLMHNDITFKQLKNILKIADKEVYQQLSESNELSEEEREVLHVLHSIMPQLEALKKKLFLIDQSISKLTEKVATLRQKLPTPTDIKARKKKFDQQARDLKIECDKEVARHLYLDSIITFTQKTHNLKEAVINYIRVDYKRKLAALKAEFFRNNREKLDKVRNRISEIEYELQSLGEKRTWLKGGLGPASLTEKSTRKIINSQSLNLNQEEIKQVKNNIENLEEQLNQAQKATTSKGKNEESERIEFQLSIILGYLEEIEINPEAKGKERV